MYFPLVLVSIVNLASSFASSLAIERGPLSLKRQDEDPFPLPVASVRINQYVLLEDRPCQITEIHPSEDTTELVGVDIFNREDTHMQTFPNDGNVLIPRVQRREYQLLDITDDGYLTLSSSDGTIRDDIELPGGDLGAQIRTLFDQGKDLLVTIMMALGESQAISVKEAP